MIAAEGINQVLKQIENSSIDYPNIGFPSGFVNLDKSINGFQKSTLTTIGGRPSMGKTSLINSMIINLTVKFNKSVLYYTLESTKNQTFKKLLSIQTGIDYKTLNGGNLEKYELEKLFVMSRSLEKSNLFINDKSDWSIEDLLLDIESNFAEKTFDIVFIDYLQLISVKKNRFNISNREQEISVIIKNIKSLSKKLDVPIILTSQLSRAVENRGGSKRPILNDLRETGAIEDDSDLEIFLYRPEYYFVDEWDDEERTPSFGEAELIISKNRFGHLDNIRLGFNKFIGKFNNLERDITNFRSRMNDAANDDTFKSSNFPSAEDAFGSTMNDDITPSDGHPDDDIPF